MLSKRYRLKSPALFKRTLDSVRLCANRCFVVYALSRKSDEAPANPRFGFIVSKKVSLNATDRNRIKRRLREIIRRDVLPSGKAGAYTAVVVIARSAMVQAPYAEIRRLLAGCFGCEG